MNNLLLLLNQILQMGNNPQTIFQNMIRNNPNAQYMQAQLNAIQNQMAQNHMSYKDMVEQIAKQNNIDLNPMINLCYQKGIKF